MKTFEISHHDTTNPNYFLALMMDGKYGAMYTREEAQKLYPEPFYFMKTKGADASFDVFLAGKREDSLLLVAMTQKMFNSRSLPSADQLVTCRIPRGELCTIKK